MNGNERAAYESALNYMARIAKWQAIIIVFFFLAFVASNVGWLIYENSFETVETVEENTVFAMQNGDDNTVVGGDINVTNCGY